MMNLTKFCDRIDHLYNLVYIPIEADVSFIAFVKKYQYMFECITVFVSFLMAISFGFMLRFISSGLQLHIHLRRLIYIAFALFVLYRIGVDGAIIMSHIYPMNAMCITFGVQQNVILFKLLEVFAAMVFIVFLLGFNIERTIATIYIQNYETWSSWLLVIGITLFMVVIAFTLTGLLIYANNALFYIVISLAIIGVCEAFMYFYTMSVNYKLYQTRVTSEIRMTLSQRYQLSENLRVLAFCKRLFHVYWIFNFIVVTVFLVYYLTEDLYITIMMHFIHQLSVLTYGIALMVSLIATGAFPTFRQLCDKFRGKKMRMVDDNTRMLSIKSSMGEQMVFQGNQEADLYFIQLEQSWATLK